MANYGCGKGMNEENLLAMRRRVLELDANPSIKPTALEKAFLEAYQERKKGGHGRGGQSGPRPPLPGQFRQQSVILRTPSSPSR